jgi:hypothetical protein
MNIKFLQYGLYVLFLLAIPVFAEDIKGFTPINQEGDCTINSGSGFLPASIGKLYPFGNNAKTGRNSFLDLEFSDGNTFRLLARTSVTITENAKDPKLKVIQLTKGTVDLKLDNFPADHKLQVETPTASCGAVGARAIVAACTHSCRRRRRSTTAFCRRASARGQRCSSPS